MQPIKRLLFAVLVSLILAAGGRAHACAPNNLTGNYNYDFIDTVGRFTHCGTATNACAHIALVNEGCNGLSSYGNVNGLISWFGNGGAYRDMRFSPTGSLSTWQYINMWFWFQWDSNWEFASCTPDGAYGWNCNMQQSHDGGTTWGPNGTMHLTPFVH